MKNFALKGSDPSKVHATAARLFEPTNLQLNTQCRNKKHQSEGNAKPAGLINCSLITLVSHSVMPLVAHKDTRLPTVNKTTRLPIYIVRRCHKLSKANNLTVFWCAKNPQIKDAFLNHYKKFTSTLRVKLFLHKLHAQCRLSCHEASVHLSVIIQYQTA